MALKMAEADQAPLNDIPVNYYAHSDESIAIICTVCQTKPVNNLFEFKGMLLLSWK